MCSPILCHMAIFLIQRFITGVMSARIMPITVQIMPHIMIGMLGIVASVTPVNITIKGIRIDMSAAVILIMISVISVVFNFCSLTDVFCQS